VLLQLPFRQEDATLRYGVPFGDVVFPEVMPGTGPFRGDEMERDAWLRLREVQGWLDLSSPGFGVGLATRTRVFELEPPTVNVVVVRSSPSRQAVRVVGGEREPIYRMPIGPVQVALSLYPHSGDWREAGTFRRGFELNSPLLPVVVADQSSPKRLPPSQSFCSLRPESLVLTALKREGDGRLLLRAYEATGQVAQASFDLLTPAKNAYQNHGVAARADSTSLCEVRKAPCEEGFARRSKRVWVASPLGEPGVELSAPPRVGSREIATWLVET
jgi:hypothetical protein